MKISFLTEYSAGKIILFRILLGTVVLAVVLSWLPNPAFYFSNLGSLPDSLVEKSNLFSILFFGDSPPLVWLWYILLLAATLCFTVGFYPRVTGVVTYVLLLSFLNRNYQMTYGGTSILLTLLFLTLFLDTGAKSHDKRPHWPFYLMQFQLAFGYFVSGLSKMHSVEWAEGKKLYAVLMDPTFSYFDFAWLRDFAWVIPIMTYGVIVAEVLFIFLCWFKYTRWLAIAMVASMHIGIFFTVNVHYFSEIMLVGLVSFLSVQEVDWLLERGNAAKARIVSLVRGSQG